MHEELRDKEQEIMSKVDKKMKIFEQSVAESQSKIEQHREDVAGSLQLQNQTISSILNSVQNLMSMSPHIRTMEKTSI